MVNHTLRLISAIASCVAVLLFTRAASAQLVVDDPTPGAPASAAPIGQFCPITGLQPRTDDFTASGVILTAFDPRATWHLDVTTGRRFPLPGIPPCGRTCRLAPDGLTLIYFNDLTNAHQTIRLDGTLSAFLTERATDVIGWGDNTFFAWSAGARPFTVAAATPGERTPYPLATPHLYTMQPGGAWGISSQFDGEAFQRALVRLARAGSAPVPLGEDIPGFNDYGWSPDGRQLAYVTPTRLPRERYTADLALVSLGNRANPRVITALQAAYDGPVRINGASVNDLAWSPDSRFVAFWVTPIAAAASADSEEPASTPPARLLIADSETGAVTDYCGFQAPARADRPPRLFWAPDGEALGFAIDVPDDSDGAFVVALAPETGVFTIVSEGLYAAFGAVDIYGWGRNP